LFLKIRHVPCGHETASHSSANATACFVHGCPAPPHRKQLNTCFWPEVSNTASSSALSVASALRRVWLYAKWRLDFVSRHSSTNVLPCTTSSPAHVHAIARGLHAHARFMQTRAEPAKEDECGTSADFGVPSPKEMHCNDCSAPIHWRGSKAFGHGESRCNVHGRGVVSGRWACACHA
jgi:hypothetical protein